MFNAYKNIQGQGKQLLIARVKKVILGPKINDSTVDPDYTSEKDLGAIKYELLYSGKMTTGQLDTTKPAYPIHGFIRQYPLINEIVMLMQGPSADMNDSSQNQDLYYFPPFSLFNSAHMNPFPNMEEYAAYIKNQLVDTTRAETDTSYLSLPVGATFVEKDNVKNLRPFEGDTIFQGRWGQSIRLGSTVPTMKSSNPWSLASNELLNSGDPISIFVNSQRKYVTNVEKNSPTTVEDINKDGSSIYMTSTQPIVIDDINTFQIRSWKLSTSVDPKVNVVVIPEQVPRSNEFISAKDQDDKSLNV